jgi:hypothetical protein
MFFGTHEHLDHIGDFILKLVYPHEHNNHRPWALQSSGLVIFLVLVLVLQAGANFASRSGSVLGFATNITVAQVTNLTNSERISKGLSTLKTNSSLSKAAEFKAKDMFEDDYWSHFAPDGTSPWYFFNLVGYKYTWAGENLARDFATSSGVVSAWMDSSGHRANVLNPNFTEIGIAVVDGNLQGEDTTLVVQLFGKPVAMAAGTGTNKASEGAIPTAESAKVEAELNLPSSSDEGTTQVTGEAGNTELAGPVTKASTQGGVPFVSLVAGATASQKVTISLLLVIAVLFVFDSIIIYRRRHLRHGSHSLAHASMIILLIAVSLLYGKGTIL